MGCLCLGGDKSGGKSGKKKLKLVLVGLDGAGKSTLLQTMLGEKPEKTMPTFGFNNARTKQRERGCMRRPPAGQARSEAGSTPAGE